MCEAFVGKRSDNILHETKTMIYLRNFNYGNLLKKNSINKSAKILLYRMKLPPLNVELKVIKKQLLLVFEKNRSKRSGETLSIIIMMLQFLSSS